MKRIACILIVFICLLCIQTSSFADSINLPAGLVEIKEEAFYGDTSITEVTVLEGTTTIGPRAFAYSGLQKIFLPESVENIDLTAFDGLPESFTIFAPRGSDSHQYALDNHYNWCDTSYNDFMLWMLQKYDSNGNGLFDEAEIAAVKEINCDNKGFASLDGIEVFSNLKSLSCENNQLLGIDISNNPELTSLDVSHNKLQNLDVSGNPELIELYCSYNQLTSLNVSDNPELKDLYCMSNQLTYIDVSRNLALKRLSCGNNHLTNLNVSKNVALTYLECADNQLASLDVSENSDLDKLTCLGNQLTSLDVSYNPLLTWLLCEKNQLTSLYMNYNPNLLYLRCYSNQLTSIDIRNCDNLVNLFHNGSKKELEADNGSMYYVYRLDQQGKVIMMEVDCDVAIISNEFMQWMLETHDTNGNGLFDIDEIAGVTNIDCSGHGFISLNGIEIFYNLQQLNCSNNHLTTLDISNNTALSYLSCFTNQLTNLNVSNNLKLKALDCSDNTLGDLNVGNNTALTYLGCCFDQLTSLDVSNNTALIQLYCYSNEFTSLDIKNLTKLEEFHCANNQLTNLDVSKNTKLQYLNCQNNRLTNLNLSANTELQYFQCWYNRLTEINLINNAKLRRVNLSANNSLSDLTIGNAQNLEMLWVQNTSILQLDLRDTPILVQAYLQGIKREFNADGSISNNGSFVGYYLGDGLYPESQREIEHCQLCFNKNVEVIT